VPTAEQILRSAYRAFNVRDIDTAVELMHPDVDWPNAWEGGRVIGHAAVIDYWTRQFAAIPSSVEPERFAGEPGSHHVLSRVFKDIYPRYRTMRGHRVPRKAGWDCHGLPVELEVERELGITSKAEIEAYGIAEFNQRCRESVFRYVEDWARLTERIGFWIELDDAYVTLRYEYIE